MVGEGWVRGSSPIIQRNPNGFEHTLQIPMDLRLSKPNDSPPIHL